MHIYSRDQQAFHLSRTEMEKWFSRLNTLIVGMNVICFITAIVRIGSAATNSMVNSFFGYSTLELSPVYTLEGCNYTVSETHGGVFGSVTYEMNPNNIGYFVSRHVLQVRYMLAVTGVQAAVSVANRACFEFNVHELRYNFVVFKKDMLTIWELMLLSVGAVLVLSVNTENTHILNYLIKCNGNVLLKTYNTVVPSVELEISIFGTLAVYAINVVVAAYNMLSKPNPLRELLKKDEENKKQLDELNSAASENRSDGMAAGVGQDNASGSQAGEAASERTSSGPVAPHHQTSNIRGDAILHSPDREDAAPHASSAGSQHTAAVSASPIEGNNSSAGIATEASMRVPATNSAALSAMEVVDDNAEDEAILARLARQRNTTVEAGGSQAMPAGGLRRRKAPPHNLCSPAFEASSSVFEGEASPSDWQGRPLTRGGEATSVSPSPSVAGRGGFYAPNLEASYYSNPVRPRGRRARGSEHDAGSEDTVQL